MNVLLFFGGDSAEREISLITAKQLEQMKTEHKIFPILLRDKKMYYCPNFEPKECAKDILDNKKFIEVVVADSAIYKFGKKLKKITDADAAILACHGGCGENGELSSYLKLNNIKTSVGNGLALGIAMDKVLAKAIFREFEVPTVDSFWFFKRDWDESREEYTFRAENLGYPLCVKPARQGSSVGITFVKDKEDLDDAVELALEYDDKILVEKGLDNFRELNVSVISSDSQIVVSEVEEPIRNSDILTFADKYLNGAKGGKLGKLGGGAKTASESQGMAGLSRKFPADIDEKTKETVQNIATDIIRKLEFFGVARLDFLYCDGQIYLNEINSIPGSLAHYFWTENLNGDSFVDKLVNLCFDKKRERQTAIAKFLK